LAHVKKEIADEKIEADERAALFTALTLVKHSVIILKGVIDRYGARRDHGLYATIVEELLRELYVGSLRALAWILTKNDTGPTKAFLALSLGRVQLAWVDGEYSQHICLYSEKV